MPTPLYTCISSQVELFIAVNNIFLVVISCCLTFSEQPPPPISTLSFTHMHCDFWQLLWNMKSCHWLSLVAQAGWGLCRSASEISLVSSTAVSVQWPHGALACRLFPFHPPRALMTSAPRLGDWGREGREVAWWRIERGVGVGVQKEGKEVGGLASQGDDEGECVWFGKWVAGICVSLGITFFFFCTHISRKMRPILPHSPAACVKQVSWLA